MSSSAFVPLGHSAVYEAFINPNSSFRAVDPTVLHGFTYHVITEISRNHRLHEPRWWILAILKIRYWSEIVAGPRWKTFIRRFNRARHKVGSTSQVICHELHVYPASALKASSYVQLIRPAAVVNIATLKGLKGELGKKPTALGRIVIYIKESLIDLLPW
ncbi:hypothetical protein YC2023_086177 [Brassica napus]|uniref:Uncharacterized protein n=1 Tax=Brassica oleracea TaxID=3712 RepID=A0A3P6E533_BRAOL|nr:unnamed protein product [Brassica oleracea]